MGHRCHGKARELCAQELSKHLPSSNPFHVPQIPCKNVYIKIMCKSYADSIAILPNKAPRDKVLMGSPVRNDGFSALPLTKYGCGTSGRQEGDTHCSELFLTH